MSGRTSLVTHYSGGLTIKSTTWAPGYPCCCSAQRAVKIRDTGNQTDDWNKVDCRICLSKRAHLRQLDSKVKVRVRAKEPDVKDEPEQITKGLLDALVLTPVGDPGETPKFLVIEVQGLPGFRASVEIAAVQELRQALDVILGPLTISK